MTRRNDSSASLSILRCSCGPGSAAAARASPADTPSSSAPSATHRATVRVLRDLCMATSLLYWPPWRSKLVFGIRFPWPSRLLSRGTPRFAHAVLETEPQAFESERAIYVYLESIPGRQYPPVAGQCLG